MTPGAGLTLGFAGSRRVSPVLVGALAIAALAVSHGESAATGDRPWGVLVARSSPLAGLAAAFGLRRDAALERAALAVTAILLVLPLVGRLAVLRHGVIVTTLDPDLVRALVVGGLAAAAGVDRIGDASLVAGRRAGTSAHLQTPNGSPSASSSNLDAEARTLGRPQPPVHGGGIPVALPTVTQALKSTVWMRRSSRRRERQVRHRRGVDVAAAGVLDRHRQAELDRHVPQLRGGSDAADAGDLERHAVRHAVARRGAPARRASRPHSSSTIGSGAVGAHRAALLVGHAWLLQPDLHARAAAQERARRPVE